jgi:outer membrane protein assembly factor BamA
LRKKIIIILLLVLFGILSILQAEVTKADSADEKKTRLFAYPYAFYTPETKFAFGGGVILNFFTGKEDQNPSQSVLGGYYSTNHNFYSSLNTHIYHKDIHVHPWIYAAKVVDKFYGIGNNTPDIKDEAFYNAKKIGVRIDFEKYINKFILGVIFNWSYWNVYDKLANPYLNGNNFSGRDGGYTSGFGLSIGVDTRDYVFLPTDGSYHEFKIIHFNKYFGGDFIFTKYLADLRGYHTFLNKIITGWQLYGEGVTGNAPFYDLPALGGSERMRGFYEGRYRDNFYLTGQMEAGLLFRIFKKMNRFGAVLFASFGEVAHEINDFNISAIKASYGVGFGYMLDEKDRTVIRAEFGFAKGTSGIYFAAGLPF